MALEDWIPFSVVIKAQDPYEEGVAFFVVLDAVIVAVVAEQPVVPVVADLAAEIHIVVAEMLQRRDVVVVVEQRRLAERLAVLPELELAGRLALSLAQVVVVEHQSLSSLLFLFFEHHVERVGVELPVVERLVVVDGVMLLVLLVVPAGQPELLVARLAELAVAVELVVPPLVVVLTVVLVAVLQLDVLVAALELLVKYEEMEGLEMLDDHVKMPQQD